MWGNRTAVPTFHIRLENMGRFIGLLCKALPNGWTRGRLEEYPIRERDPNPVSAFIKECATDSPLPHVAIKRTAFDEWQVSVVTIHQERWFSDEECVAELKKFETALIATASNCGVTVQF